RRHTRFKCDWSSDVCSSDLQVSQDVPDAVFERFAPELFFTLKVVVDERGGHPMQPRDVGDRGALEAMQAEGLEGCIENPAARGEIGRASCRERRQSACGQSR